MSDITQICNRMVNCYGKEYPLSTVRTVVGAFERAFDSYEEGTLAGYGELVFATVNMRILIEQLRIVLGDTYMDLTLKVELDSILEKLERADDDEEKHTYNVAISGENEDDVYAEMHIDAGNTLSAAKQAYMKYMKLPQKRQFAKVSKVTVGNDVVGWIVKYDLIDILTAFYTGNGNG